MPVLLASGHKEMDHINDYANKALKGNKKAKEMVVHYVDQSGKHRIKGGSDLKSSQSYPRGSLVLSSVKALVCAPIASLSSTHSPCPAILTLPGSAVLWQGSGASSRSFTSSREPNS